ncbi:hypothetical protein BR10RB9215_C12189 [Brucella sp. 10RB9215]|nr:hypothetical protein BR10RB9215_C12189 [Brucella sp. 10RB9215]
MRPAFRPYGAPQVRFHQAARGPCGNGSATGASRCARQWEGARAYFQIERTLIAGGNLVEFLRTVSDDAREDIKPPVELFGLAEAEKLRRERKAFQKRDDIDATRFQNRTCRQVDFMQFQPLQLVDDRCARPRHEGSTHPIGLGAKAQVKARWLNLIGIQQAGRSQQPLSNSAAISASARIPASLCVINLYSVACRAIIFR